MAQAILECLPTDQLSGPANTDWPDEPSQFGLNSRDDERGCFDESRRRADRIRGTKIEFLASREFDVPDADDRFLGPMPPSPSDRKSLPTPPPGTPPYLAELYSIPLLTKEQEQHLFRKMNYLKYRAWVLRERLLHKRPQADLLDRIETLLDDALAVRNQIVRANLRLVVSIAKKLVDRANSFEELVSDGNLPLIRAVEIFDFERGTRFSTYATWAIRNSLYRATARNRRIRGRFACGHEGVFGSVADQRATVRGHERYHQEVGRAVKDMLSRLDSRDQTIVISRFGLGENGRPHRFREIAEQLHISTERVRQLLSRSLGELQESTVADQVDLAP